MSVTLHHGKLEDVLPTKEAESMHAFVGDPPYGIRFMGQAWDGKDIVARTQNRHEYRSCADADPRAGTNGAHNSIAAEAGKYDRSNQANQAFQAWTEMWAREVFRVLKPGAWLVSFSSTRTYHRMVCGIEDAGFEIRDQLAWVFGSGFPKSLNLDGEWEGWGTALKPGWEPIVLARKPLVGTVADNIAAHRTGALNINGCRLVADKGDEPFQWSSPRGGIWKTDPEAQAQAQAQALGRWPANLCHDGSPEVMSMFPSEAGASAPVAGDEPAIHGANGIYGARVRVPGTFFSDAGSAARFYYCAKASREDREDGCDDLTAQQQDASRKEGNPGGDNPRNRGLEPRKNFHPTVKPTALMRWLCRLVTPPGGTVLDCFMGSGSTGRAAVLEGFDFVGVEMTDAYLPIARARIAAAENQKRDEDEEKRIAGLQGQFTL